MQKLVEKVNIHLFDQCFDYEIISKLSLRYDKNDISRFNDIRNKDLESRLKLLEQENIESSERIKQLLNEKTKHGENYPNQIKVMENNSKN